jgi:hypothetical protein
METFSKYNMEPRDMIYGARPIQNGSYIKYYSYWDCEQRSMVITDNYDEYNTHEMRKRMGGDRGIHSTLKNTQD